MSFQHADNISLIVFVLFSLIMLCILIKTLLILQSKKTWLTLFISLVLLFSLGAISGLTSKFFIPLGPLLFGLGFIYSFSLVFSSAGKELAQKLSFVFLIGFQSFRLPLELILHHWAELKTVPPTMTWTGQNIDILAGILSLIAIPILRKSSRFVILFNSIGFLLLLNVFRVIILSLPVPFAWKLDYPIRLIEFFPYCLIAPLFVVPALIGHLLVFRKSLLDMRAS